MAKGWKQPKCPAVDEWINEMWSGYTTKYPSALKRKEILTGAATWVKLEDITLNKINQLQRTIIV